MPTTLLVARNATAFVSAPEAAEFCRVTDDGELGALAGFVDTAVDMVEDYTGLALTSNQYLWASYGWPQQLVEQFPWYARRPEVLGRIELGRTPLVSIQSVKYYDEAGVLQTIDPSSYYADTLNTPGAVVFKADFVQPTLISSQPRADALQIAFTAGGSAPARAKQAVLFWVKHFYDNRDATVMGSTAEIPLGLKHLLNSLKV